MSYITVALITAIAGFAFWILYRERLISGKGIILSGILLVISFGGRWLVLDHITLDYENFLSVWMQYFRDNGGFGALSRPIGNYNLPYLYFLALFSYLPVNDLHLIKLLSIFFDVILAWYAMGLVGLYVKSNQKKLLTFFVVLLLPTVFLNGSMWGQCDSIYAAFALMGVYYGLKGSPVRSMICITLSFAFKLQAVFIMPVFLVFLFSRRIKLRHLPIFPAVYILTALPAILMGYPAADAILLYFNQADSVGSGLNYNSPSVFAFVQNVGESELLSAVGIGAALLFVLLVYVLLFRGKRKISDKMILDVSLLFAVGIPLLLPHMHDRYFFMADVLAVCCGIVSFKRFPVILLTQFASLLGYHAYLEARYFLPMKYGTVALILVALLLIFDLLRSPTRRSKRDFK